MALTKIPSSLLDTSGGFDLQGNITLGDNEQIQLGDSSDLAIYHDGSNSYIKENGVGNLYVQGQNHIFLTNSDASKTYFAGNSPTGWVKLYHDNDVKFETTSTGATVTGNLAVTGDLDITGDINSYNVTDLDVTDKTITLGAGQTEANSGGSGIIIDGSSASILWDETNTEWDFNNSINVTGTAQATRLGLGVAPHATAGLNITTTNQHIRLNNGSELGIIHVLSTGELELWGHGDGESINFRTGSGSGTVAMNVVGTNVGIGTTSPSNKLQITTSGAGNPYIGFDHTGDNPYMEMQRWSGTASDYFGTRIKSYQSVLAFENTGSSAAAIGSQTFTERMRIDASGNVGIGTDSTFNSGARLEVNDLGAVGTILLTRSGSPRVELSTNANEGELSLYRSNNAKQVYLSSYYNSYITGGNLGIGTTNPTEKLEVAGSIVCSNFTDEEGIFFRSGFSNNNKYNVSIMAKDHNGNAADGLSINGYDGISFCTGSNSRNEVVRITGGSSGVGMVGIGTTNPTGSLHLTTVDSGGADVYYVAQNTTSNRLAGYQILDESGNNKVNLNYDNGSNRGTLSMGDADGEIIYVYNGTSIKSGFGIDLSGSSRELSIFHTSSGTDGNIALGKRLESNGTFSASVQITPAGVATTANLIVNNVNSNAFNHVQENKVPNLTAGEDVFLGLGKSTNTKNMGYLGYEWNASGSDNNYIHLSHWGADGLFRVYGNGNYSFAGSNVSDRDLKENIISVTDTALDKITQLEVRKFNFIKDYEVSSDGGEVETPRTQVGFIAQEVEAIIPDITVGTDGQKDMGVDTVGLVGYLTKAIQELKTELDAAKARITELEG